MSAGTLSITGTNIYQNNATTVSLACFELEGPPQRRAGEFSLGKAPMEDISRKLPECSNCSQGGGIYAHGGSVLLTNGTILSNNSATRGATIYVETAVVVYVLPVPAGHYVSASLCKRTWAACPLPCQDQCTKNISLAPSASSGGSCDLPPFQFQGCPWSHSLNPYARPELLGMVLETVLAGELNTPTWPAPCSPGILGATSTDMEGQASPQCRRPCPAGYYCPSHNTTVPLPCDEGHYCPVGSVSPVECADGRYSNATMLQSADQCTEAPPGFYSPKGSPLPTECGSPSLFCPGGEGRPHAAQVGYETYTNLSFPGASDTETTRTSERPCSVGHWCSAGVSNPCAPDSYANQTVPLKDRTNQRAACVPCYANARTTTLAISAADCLCEEGFYRGAVCHDCPVGAQCGFNTTEATLRVGTGYWRRNITTADVRPCPVNGSTPLCRGDITGVLGDYCDSSTTGIDPTVPYCSHCIHHPMEYLNPDRATCQPCSGPRYALMGYVIAVSVLMLTVTLLKRFATTRWERATRALSQLVVLVSLHASPMAMVKQMFGFYQISTHFHQVFGVTLPPSFLALQGRLELLNFNIFALPGLHMQCFGLSTFASQLLFRALVPAALVGMTIAYHWWHREPIKALPSSLWITFLVFSLVSSPAFQAFSCEAFDDVSYLRADYSVICSSNGEDQPAYAQLKLLASVVIIIYPVGIPVVYAVLLFTSRHTVTTSGNGWLKEVEHALRTHSDSLNFLTANYRRPYFWWELVETVKKLLLASFFALPFMGHGTLVQLLVALALQLVFLVVQVYAAPFKRASDNYFALSTNVALVFGLFSCMVLKQDELVEATAGVLEASLRSRYHVGAGSMAVVLIVSTLSVLVVTLAILFHTVASVRHVPFLRAREDGAVVEPPPTQGWHALISHVWSTGQVRSSACARELT